MSPADFTAAIEKLQRTRDFHRDEADRLTVEISGLLMAAIEADAAALEARIGGYPGGGQEVCS